jgi:hypothetical protein
MREKKLTRLGTGKSSDMATVTAVPARVAVPAASVKKAPKEIFASNSDFCQLADVLTAEEEANRQGAAHTYGDQGLADHQQVPVR